MSLSSRMSLVATGAVLRVQVVSDLHVDLNGTEDLVLAPGADLVVIAGDTCAGATRALKVLRRCIPAPTPIVAVLGNHEFYGSVIADELARARETASALGIKLLENDAAVVAGVRFVGCTLWTNYELRSPGYRQVAMEAASRGMNDHRAIAASDHPNWRPFRPSDAADLHAESVDFIARTLGEPHDGPSAVVTHHGPHPACIANRFARQTLSAAFASDLSDLIATTAPDVWISGHTHHPIDRQVLRTRLFSNPRGYGEENPAFAFDRIIHIPLTRFQEERP